MLAAAGVVAMLGAVLIAGHWPRIDEGQANDRLVRAYLDALADGEYDAAYALLCTDESGVDKSRFIEEQQGDPVRTSQVESYQVRITRTSGAVAVEPVATQSGRCVQYGR